MKKGQKVWYIDHTYNELKIGTLVSTENASDREEEPSLSVKGKYGTHRILEGWVFGTEKTGKTGMKRKIRQDIDIKRCEISRLKQKLFSI